MPMNMFSGTTGGLNFWLFTKWLHDYWFYILYQLL